VASSLESAIKEHEAAVVCVTSARQGDGKTIIALNVAAAAALGGRRVVLVDGDTHARGLSRWVGRNEAKGLTDLGAGTPPEECVLPLEWGAGLLAMCPAGSPVDAGAGFFRSAGFRRAVATLRERGDLIVIDAPPALASADALAIAGKSDGVIVVVEFGTPLRAVEDAGERITTAGTPILGYVFNRVRARESRYGYRYGYGYGSTYGHGYGHKPGSGSGDGRGEGRRRRDRRRGEAEGEGER
jgi:Mrp family chromosome partitioning ATPase